jgi:uncharacterized protein (UPF0335 family)
MSVLPFKEDEDFRKHNQHAEEHAAGELQNLITEYESLDAQVADMRRDQKDLLTVAKSKGWNTKALRRLFAERKRDAGELQEEQEAVQMYRKLLLFCYTTCGRFPTTGIAGGDTMRRANTDVGRAGEFLAAYILETHGIEVHHVDRAGADLWCKVQGSIVTVQVKSSHRPHA